MIDMDYEALRKVAEEAVYSSPYSRSLERDYRLHFDPPTVLALLDLAQRAEADRAAIERVLVNHGHSDTSGSELGDYPCSCWKADLRAALDPQEDQ